MSENKYISVIHVPTDKIVTAFKFENDATWVGKENDELIATANYCEPGQKIKMIFVKSYKRNSGKNIYAYFRASPNQEKLKTNISGESDEHKKAKQNIYNGIYSGDIKINDEIIDKEKIDDIYIEYRTSKYGYVIPDILIKFKEEDKKYGVGIFVEVQLSKQHEEETLLRTYSRIIEGFSGVWLWREDLDEDMELINKNLQVKSHRQLLSELDEKIENKFIKRINNYGKLIDNKLQDFKKELWDYFNSSYKSFRIEADKYSKDEINKLQISNDRLKQLKDIASDINFSLENINIKQIKTELETEKENFFKNLDNGLPFKINEYTRKALNQCRDKMNRMCPKCNTPMKIGKAMGGYNWYCQDFPIKCDGLIKEVDFNES